MKKLFYVLATIIVLSLFPIYAIGSIPLPTRATIAKDLVGRSLAEGVDDGYFGSDWRWTIEPEEIVGLSIQSQDNTKDYCTFIVALLLKKENCPTKFRATVQVEYSLVKNVWTLGLVRSKGIKVVSTGRYLDCVSAKIGDNYSLKIKNNIDSSLLVGGVYRTSSSCEWRKFAVTIPGLKAVDVWGSWCVEDFRIHFVEPY